jgi:hypothetical protein
MNESKLFCCPDGIPRLDRQAATADNKLVQEFCEWAQKADVAKVGYVSFMPQVPTHGFCLAGHGGRCGNHVSLLKPRFFVSSTSQPGAFSRVESSWWENLGLKEVRL